jgi:hypothetical protein
VVPDLPYTIYNPEKLRNSAMGPKDIFLRIGRSGTGTESLKGFKKMRKNYKIFEYSKFQRTTEFGESVTILKGICRRFPPQYAVSGLSWGDYLFPTVECGW